MKIPKKLKIGGRIFRVSLDDSIADTDRNAQCLDGRIIYSEGKITLNSSVPRDRQEECFFHEIIHGAMDVCDLNTRLNRYDPNLAEDTVTALSSILYQIFRDNRMLAE
ncbi:MAG: hypothetical protein ABIH23_10120 [bacterium]